MSLVSVIIPTRNRATLLRQTIRSVLDQTWPDTEIIVVDEASEDNTQAVLDDFGDRLDVVQHETPKGPSVARNVGVNNSSGEYVVFLDDDDLLHPRHVEELIQFSEGLPLDHIAASGWRRFRISESGVEVGPVVRPPETWKEPEAVCAMFGHDPGCLVWGPSVLWPRSVVEEIQWDEDLYTNGDIDFYARILGSGYTFVGTNAGMAYYRSHTGVSVSGKSATNSESARSLVSGAKCRLKHSTRLRDHPKCDKFASAMREALMRILVRLEAHGGLTSLARRVEREYKEWGGRPYFLPQPPQNWFKRHLLETSLSVGGPKTVGLLLRFQSKLSEAIDCEVSPNVEIIDYEFLIRQLVSAESASATPSK
ncbi:glycosyltransferase family 2 protein [Salinibacter ruber]|uniref:glycosyltransferase family 2 protein n=1 Tax=Salinibacter ruber TaxID=146919 RepID=UPI0021670D2D|nr:glycosyltransferase [Salinibacter ruber]MCS3703584.1 glycosyltransferase involved in cell wall biosynthesis [Salinibacter ruber]